MIELRKYQQESVEKTIEYLNKRVGNPVLVAPTGAGKSIIIAALCDLTKKNLESI